MLDFTPKEIKERKALVINPAKTCQPIGAMYAALGINGCMPHSHGSQGCCSFHRMHLTRHFRDPIVATTSSFTEGASVFGGGSNLKTSLKNIFAIYDPKIVAVHTTCLSETIGDDLTTIISEAAPIIPEGKLVISTSTPSYVGSHITGFSNMVKSTLQLLAEGEGKGANGKINIIPGFVNPGDMTEIKELLEKMDVPFTMLPDTSGVVDSPMTSKYEMYPEGGTKIEDIQDAGNSKATIALGTFASEAGSIALETKCGVPSTAIKMPVGVKATDEFLMEVSKITGKPVPWEIEKVRGQVVDIMVDTHHHFHGKKVGIFGDPDQVIAMTEFVLSLGMVPKFMLTGTPGKAFDKQIEKVLDDAGVNKEDSKYMSKGDLFLFHQWIKNEPVDLIIGNTYGKYIARAEDTPLVRFGFPVLDRSVHTYLPTVGYKGAMRLIEKISDALLERADRDAEDKDLELVM
ncbi:nitrogenase molybdenum-iron protein subunit beta [Ilyobacter polytropus]|uniref:Nitrogenase molybdenum-iron protein beta chain n=1 Tax=Ilyobacter polytropus (strain ATCC 51220 / DSM 2926 / LMG 16218 / CuHBu1) TaxID=572544 RepID=E3HAJ9_ILYPC|nr:nitrogenase molybdenum-iron protein subunit beta [Ilyobacter polytropus]ADO83186.1 Mo-nitrogenase MoFe protein subunit NifK [Ilyobacter polytropus DSM 2926]